MVDSQNPQWFSQLKETNFLGRIHPDTLIVNDAKKLKNLKVIPNMKKIDVYHDTRLVFGYEVTYQLPDQDNKKFQVGHHIGSHLTAEVTCSTFEFEDGEYINNLVVYAGDLVDSIYFETNKNRNFKAGGSGGGPNPARMEGKNPRVVALGAGLGGHVHHFRVYYVDQL
eukprot:403335728